MSSAALQITYSADNRTKRQAGKRLYRYCEPALRRKVWLVTVAFALVIIGLFYLYGLKSTEIDNALYANCYFFVETTDIFDHCKMIADNASQSLRHLSYLLLGIAVLVIFFLYWRIAQAMRSACYSLDGRSFTVSLSPEGLTHEEAGRTRLFYHWSAVYRLIEDKDFLLFYIDRNIAYFIPQTVFIAAQMDSHAFFLQARQFKENS